MHGGCQHHSNKVFVMRVNTSIIGAPLLDRSFAMLTLCAIFPVTLLRRSKGNPAIGVNLFRCVPVWQAEGCCSSTAPARLLPAYGNSATAAMLGVCLTGPLLP